MRNKIALALFVVGLPLLAGGSETALTNNQIVGMVASGVPAESIEQEIASSPAAFQLTNEAVIALVKANVPVEVIAAMKKKMGGGSTTTVSMPIVKSAPVDVRELPSTMGVYVKQSEGNIPLAPILFT